MTIKVGDRLPAVTVRQITPAGPVEVTTDTYFRGKRVVLFGVPGAFTPTSSQHHLPNFISKAGELKAKGIDEIACIAVNDAFVLSAWGRLHQKTEGDITMLADGSAEFTRAVGLDLDLTNQGLGARSQRYSMLIEDGVVKSLHIDIELGEVKQTGADVIFADLVLPLNLEGNPPNKTG
jgi:glutaredoxin/glutathione-dependent peroxiredoxin